MSDYITLAHGSGGSLYRELVNDIFVPAYSNSILDPLNDSAICDTTSKVALTTDSFVVQPLFFPGGDIGELSVCGTVNDLAVSGAKPAYLTVGMVIESGFSKENLKRIVNSIAETAKKAEVKIVTGDTKVVETGKCDGIYINTAGVGLFVGNHRIIPQKIKKGDVIICSSAVACHGVAVMAARNNMNFEPLPMSDARPLNSLIQNALDYPDAVHAMRDPTRGGVACTLCEWVEKSDFDIEIDLSSVPIKASTRKICDLLGLDPLTVANEGVVLLSVASEYKNEILERLRLHPYGADATVIGTVVEGTGKVYGITDIGSKRRIIMPGGEILPRIC